MAKHVLLVFAAPSEGAEDEFNRWYNEVHLGEVVQTEGFVRAQRFELDEAGAGMVGTRYLAIYEVDADDVEMAKKALADARSSFHMSRAIDLGHTQVAWASAISPVVEG